MAQHSQLQQAVQIPHHWQEKLCCLRAPPLRLELSAVAGHLHARAEAVRRMRQGLAGLRRRLPLILAVRKLLGCWTDPHPSHRPLGRAFGRFILLQNSVLLREVCQLGDVSHSLQRGELQQAEFKGPRWQQLCLGSQLCPVGRHAGRACTHSGNRTGCQTQATAGKHRQLDLHHLLPPLPAPSAAGSLAVLALLPPLPCLALGALSGLGPSVAAAALEAPRGAVQKVRLTWGCQSGGRQRPFALLPAGILSASMLSQPLIGRCIIFVSQSFITFSGCRWISLAMLSAASVQAAHACDVQVLAASARNMGLNFRPCESCGRSCE